MLDIDKSERRTYFSCRKNKAQSVNKAIQSLMILLILLFLKFALLQPAFANNIKYALNNNKDSSTRNYKINHFFSLDNVISQI